MIAKIKGKHVGFSLRIDHGHMAYLTFFYDNFNLAQRFQKGSLPHTALVLNNLTLQLFIHLFASLVLIKPFYKPIEFTNT